VHLFAEAVVVHVCIVSYAAGHGKECVMEMVRVESADSPLSAMVGVPKVMVYSQRVNKG